MGEVSVYQRNIRQEEVIHSTPATASGGELRLATQQPAWSKLFINHIYCIFTLKETPLLYRKSPGTTYAVS